MKSCHGVNTSGKDLERTLFCIEPYSIPDRGEKKHKERVACPNSAKSNKNQETGAHTGAHTAGSPTTKQKSLLRDSFWRT
jgi:hypothetical protein